MSLAGRQDLAVTDGLRVNLARTAVEVAIPDEHLVLLDVTAGWLGLEAATHDLLREVHHRYVAWPQALVDLHRRAMGDLHRYNAHERGAEGIAVFCDLYAKVVEEASDAPVRHDAMRLWLYYLEKLAADSGDRLERNMAPLRRSLRRIGEILDRQPAAALGASPRLKRLAAALLAQGDGAVAVALREALDVLARSLAIVYEGWLAREDPAAWYREISGRSGRSAPEGIAGLSHQRLVALAEELERIRAGASPAERASALLELPDNGQIVRAYLDAAGLVARGGDPSEALLAEMHWLFRVLGHPDLVAVHEPALRQVRRCCSSLLAAADGQRPELLVREVFTLLRRGRFPYGRTVYDLIEQIGRDVLGRGDGALADALFEETLGLDFSYPEFSGFSEEWEVLSNPDHLRNVRMYLGVIEVDPLLARPLLAALVVHLKLGGLLVTDTDLFQRDISSLLGRPVGPVYLHVKQLLKLVPAYFNEIGAEGALREASTRLDELEGRRDPLCHFLRKQSHVECNPRLVTFVEEIIRFYWTGDPDPLRRYVPPELGEHLRADDAAHRPLRGVLTRLAHDGEAPDRLFELELAEVTARLHALEEADPIAVRKAELLFRVRHEIRRKYDLDHSDVVERLRAFGRIDWARVAELEDALDRRDHDAALERLLGILETLQTLILRAGPTEAVESIYHKRHIAAGIPSMYGSYREERFEAIGLSFRLESLATALLERVIDDGALTPLDRQRLARIAGWLRLLLRALRIDGYRAQGLAHCLSMLDEAVTREGTGLDQYLNVFQLISRNIETLIRARILDVYEQPTRRVIEGMVERGLLAVPEGCSIDEAVIRHSETVLRDLIAESFGLQRLDALVGRVLRSLVDELEASQPSAGARRAPVNLKDGIVRIDSGEAPGAGIISLGNKGFMLKRLRQLGFRVPDGFILTTNLFRARGSGPLGRSLVSRVHQEIERLEHLSGARFGDPSQPLLLSVRGGAPLSMPGMLETFLNVGMNPAVAEGMGEQRERSWAAWDAYRRLLQFWGMSHGLERDGFDALMREAKRRAGAPKKALLPVSRMRELALSYRAKLLDGGVRVVDDPFEQLIACIDRVQRSWQSAHARAYRRELGISDGWGTAVIVQSMVFGNLGPRSGTGVVLTRHPRHEGQGLQLYGDFVVQGQGDDVVAGLVDTFPITERQRRCDATTAPVSLEGSFPAIHGGLEAVAHSLVQEHGMNHQELEFTFEGDREEDLFILQTRDTVIGPASVVAAFEPTFALERARVATGIGVGGGALSGRVSHTAGDLPDLRTRFPGDPILLLRPDTVPDDIPLVLQVDGLLTAIGGATSHAAVAAKRLGKTCVVGCKPFEVHEWEGWSRLGRHVVRTGDVLSISGIDGAVYLGPHPITQVRVRGRAQE